MVADQPLTDLDLVKLAKHHQISKFRGIYMRDDLPSTPPRKEESAIVNLDSKVGTGSHWVCYRKKGSHVLYFDSFGDLPPPLELLRYWGPKATVHYNYKRKQSFNSFNCGHLCIEFLSKH